LDISCIWPIFSSHHFSSYQSKKIEFRTNVDSF